MTKHTCCWVVKVATWDPETRRGVPMVRCDAPVGYTNPVHADSGQRERKYNNFCDKHMAEAAAMPDEPEEDEWKAPTPPERQPCPQCGYKSGHALLCSLWLD